MSKKKDDYEVIVKITPQKAKFFGLDVQSASKDLDKAFNIDWRTEKRAFVDLGNSYAYNPAPTPFNVLREQFYNAGAEHAPRLLARLCGMAHQSGIPVRTVVEWGENQLNRWHKERAWRELN